MYKEISTQSPWGAILRLTDGTIINKNPDNPDYLEYLKWIEAGNTPEPADEPA